MSHRWISILPLLFLATAFGSARAANAQTYFPANPGPYFVSEITLPGSGYRIRFNRTVEIRRLAIPPQPYYIVTGSQPLQVISVEHPTIPNSSSISVSFTSNTYLSTGQPYDPQDGGYNAALRITQFPFTVQATQASPKHLQFTTVEQHTSYPFLDQDRTDFLGFYYSPLPTYSLAGPVMGTPTFKGSAFNAVDVLLNMNQFDTTQPLPNGIHSLTSELPNLCNGTFNFSSYSNMSSGQKYQSHPPIVDGAPATYGSSRAEALMNMYYTLINRSEPYYLRQLGWVCFAQNHIIPYLAAISANTAINEGGGHSGGSFFLAIQLGRKLFPNNAAVQALAASVLNPSSDVKIGELTYFFVSPSDGNTYYAAPGWSAAEYANCMVGSGFFWGHSYTYCLAAIPGQPPMDTGPGGGYQQIFTGEALGSAALLINSPFLLNDYPAVGRILPYVQRYLTQGSILSVPQLYPMLQQQFEAAVATHNAAAAASNWAPLTGQAVQDAFNALSAGHGRKTISHHSPFALQTVQNHFGIAH